MTPVIESPSKVLGYEQVTGLGTAKQLTNIPNKTVWCWIQAEGQQIRVRWDDTPTATVGQPIPVGSAGVKLAMTKEELSKAQFIQSSVSATLNVTYFGNI